MSDPTGLLRVFLGSSLERATAQWKLEPDELGNVTPVLLEAGLSRRRELRITCMGGPNVDKPPHPVVIGGASVTPSSGYVLYPWDRILLRVTADVEVYATAALSASQFTYVSIVELA
jgi:hypothetical protein